MKENVLQPGSFPIIFHSLQSWRDDVPLSPASWFKQVTLLRYPEMRKPFKTFLFKSTRLLNSVTLAFVKSCFDGIGSTWFSAPDRTFPKHHQVFFPLGFFFLWELICSPILSTFSACLKVLSSLNPYFFDKGSKTVFPCKICNLADVTELEVWKFYLHGISSSGHCR